MTVREDIVRALVAAANDGMQNSPVIHDATANEVFSAHLTLLNAAMQALHAMGAPGHVLRSALNTLSLHCPLDGPVN